MNTTSVTLRNILKFTGY